MYQVKNAMHREVVSISPDASLEQAIELLLGKSISGAPVLDENGKLCGIITQFQLLEVMYDPKIRNGKVRDFMTRNVLTIDEDALLGTAVSMFVMHRIRRLPVVRNGEIVGVISRSDLLRYFMQSGEQIETFFTKLKGTPECDPTPVTAL